MLIPATHDTCFSGDNTIKPIMPEKTYATITFKNENISALKLG